MKLLYAKKRISASLVQRECRIGYNRASRIIDRMEELERWQKRKSTLEKDLVGLKAEVKRGVLNELKKVNTQIGYYKDLIRDMKMKVSPPSMLDLARK